MTFFICDMYQELCWLFKSPTFVRRRCQRAIVSHEIDVRINTNLIEVKRKVEDIIFSFTIILVFSSSHNYPIYSLLGNNRSLEVSVLLWFFCCMKEYRDNPLYFNFSTQHHCCDICYNEWKWKYVKLQKSYY